MELIAPIVLIFAVPLLSLWYHYSYYSGVVIFLLAILYGYWLNKFKVRNKFISNRFIVGIILGLIYGIGWFLWILPGSLESNARYIPGSGSGFGPNGAFFSPFIDDILVSIGMIIHVSVYTILGSYIGAFVYRIFNKKQ